VVLSSAPAVAAVPTAATVLELNLASLLQAPWWLVAASVGVGVLSALLVFVERLLRLRAAERTVVLVLAARDSISGAEIAEIVRAVQGDRGPGRKRGPPHGDPSR
jgi:hypothetical protein